MSARDEAVEMIRRICPSHLSADGYGQLLAEKFDAHRAEVVAERDTQFVAWLLKKASEYPTDPARQEKAADAIARLASKVARGAVRPNNLRTDFFQPGHGYTHRNGHDFLCVAVTSHPVTGQQLAMGWHVDQWGHCPAAVGINQWRHEYDGVEPPAGGEES
ncbi:hypothetical protein [Streptomyces flaveolus]|uniref:hypothetical protein n=1 Tax=Streptomyces flaveolus TaxID=67297 RepID=UPI001670722D|nr:hypothetical protein [Streptomyces flaveolus]GGQ83394.1 hypothetical protein GCM10010216_51490 [Streptomyces flaveolus]